MFKYNLKNQGIDVVDTVLSNRGLTFEDADKIINPNKYGYKLLNPFTFKNMLGAVCQKVGYGRLCIGDTGQGNPCGTFQ